MSTTTVLRPTLAAVLGCLLTAFGCKDRNRPSPVEPDPPASPADTAASPGTVVITLGTPDVVMRYRTDACEPEDLPDVQARAFRMADGRVALVAGNAPRNYLMVGADFNSLARVCAPVLVSGDQPTAQSFDNQSWLLSVYREGAVIHGLVHNEYHDPVAQHCKPGDTSPANPCWYNSITYVSSTDGGRSFRSAAGWERVVAAPPNVWTPPTDPRGVPSPHGYFTPSNLVRGPDSAYYSLFFAIPRPEQPASRGACVMRTIDLTAPGSWRAWDGAGWNTRMASPYEFGASQPCAFVSNTEIRDLHGSLTWNTYLQRFVLVGATATSVPGSGIVCGFYIAFSRDLIRWTRAQLIREAKQPYPPCTTAGPENSEIYPSLIDHTDTNVNFTNTGRTAYLYFVRWNQGLNRDLLRQEIRFELR